MAHPTRKDKIIGKNLEKSFCFRNFAPNKYSGFMKNVYFPEDEISLDDLYFVCYMIERVSRRLKQPNKYVVNIMGHDELAKKLSLASVLHSANPEATESDWIKE